MFLSKTIRSKLFSKKSELNVSECSTKPKSLPIEEKNVESKTYQQILDEMGEYLWTLKKYKFWTIGCLVIAWVIVFIGRWFDIGSHNPAAFTSVVFLFALLIGTKDLEKESEADTNVVRCVLQGLKFEKRLNSKSNYLQSFAKQYEGFGMFLFMFVRISPTLMIVFSLFNAGLAHFLVAYLSPQVMYGGMGIGLGLIGLFLGNVACGPYRQLLEKVKHCSP
ncbi:MAG: hypothetical protein HKM07_01750 [Chlamydiae bacterium]|nr:hypothetical protein [Chlamydiota bacterium]